MYWKPIKKVFPVVAHRQKKKFKQNCKETLLLAQGDRNWEVQGYRGKEEKRKELRWS